MSNTIVGLPGKSAFRQVRLEVSENPVPAGSFMVFASRRLLSQFTKPDPSPRNTVISTAAAHSFIVSSAAEKSAVALAIAGSPLSRQKNRPKLPAK
jgi:hypothetical protein